MIIRIYFYCMLCLSVVSCFGDALTDANNFYSAGDFRNAIRSYKKAMKQGENMAICAYNCANAYFQIDSIPQSIVYYKISLVKAPEFFKTYLNLGISYYTVEDYGQCIATLLRGLRYEPQNAKAMLLLAASYQKVGSFAEAAVTFEELTQVYPEMEEPYIGLGEIYSELGDLTEAIKWLCYYPKNGSNSNYVNKLIAENYVKMNDYGNAIYYLKNTLETEKDPKWTWYNIIDFYQKLGNELVALSTAQDVLRDMPAFGELAMLAGNLAFKLQKYEQAERFYLQAKANSALGAVTGLENIRLKRQELAGAGAE